MVRFVDRKLVGEMAKHIALDTVFLSFQPKCKQILQPCLFWVPMKKKNRVCHIGPYKNVLQKHQRMLVQR
ncbi:hypothetical protein MtrunA17_Chr3g0115961 [Medicago truncatula]|uniref:Uncharacterized protein n=1 Tax=Medicago truncatula TaxID=3880 RepID=I3S563_MEDTR|nr:unknown [Medicago truncatula]RHN68630.1 hypothetical protein MtrunA17_Chr3g0115961 [Medicago truncatula]